jgi:hypothetical protein
MADDPLLAGGIQRAVQLDLSGRQVSVAPPDVIILLKRGRMSPKDQSDIAGLQRLLEGSE